MRRPRSRFVAPVAGGLALWAATAACTTPSETSVAGFPAPTVAMTLGVADPPGRYSWDLAGEFARRVGVATAGTVRVEVTNADTEVATRWNQSLAIRAQDGDLDLALVQGQAWDALGVTSLTALYVPFVVRDEEVLDAVATGEIAPHLLAGLEGTGVTGLALLPGGLRRLVADGEVLVLPGDVRGRGVRAAYSTTVWAMFEAVGARPLDPNGDTAGERVRDGTITAYDTTFALADSVYDSPSAAGDLSTYPLAFTLVANDATLAGLSPRHREGLSEAARGTAAWAAQTRRSEADEAEALCERSPDAHVVLAGQAALDEWRGATRALAARLRSDDRVDALAARIEALGAKVVPAEPVAPCRGAGQVGDDPGDAEPQPNVPERFPEGVYRKELTAQGLMDLGVNATDAHEHQGVWALAFLANGQFGEGPGCPGSVYSVVDERLVVTLGPKGPDCGTAAGQVLFSGRWRLDGTSMSFTDVRSGHGNDLLIESLFGGEPWTKID
jgi:TRAP-type C4-dicarboxylate transport system substrate-binding protein